MDQLELVDFAGSPDIYESPEKTMVEPRGRILDDLARLVTDVAGVAGGVRREAETLVRAQLDRFINSMDLVSREEFEAVRDMAALAREENEVLQRRIAALEAKLAAAAGIGLGGSVDLYRS
jgi:BMFP domain-containing protein YqiC